jgi:bifunctional UDP-N-acetylglucosamine pyrophosphorylase/glucosamine-1-phosphate N-acetyltransferase
LMAGGTGRKNHSEVGSSYIHFNYTPDQDKATPSLIGDVPRGVMMNQPAIFLGGQGGLVGPCRLAYGTVIAAGSIYRKDELRPGRLLFEGGGKGGSIPFTPGVYTHLKRKVMNNLVYIANLMALMQWYVHVRSLFVSHDFPETLLNGLVEKLKMGIDERIKRLAFLRDQMPGSAQTYKEIAKENASSILLQQKNELYEKWHELEKCFKTERNAGSKPDLMDTFLEKVHLGITVSGKEYVSVIKGLHPDHAEAGTRWLQGIVDTVVNEALNIIPSFT